MRGLFVTATDTGVGKTQVTTRIAAALVAAGQRVGVYKPAESGIPLTEGGTQSDAYRLWNAAGRPGSLEEVCPQRFSAPLAPHLAAREEGREIDSVLLRQGVDAWRNRCDILLVEGAGGLMSPVSDDEYVADLAYDFGFPLLIVAPNVLGVINQTLQTLITAATFRDGLEVAGLVLNDHRDNADDVSVASNRTELEKRCVPPVLTTLGWNAESFETAVDWNALAEKASRH